MTLYPSELMHDSDRLKNGRRDGAGDDGGGGGDHDGNDDYDDRRYDGWFECCILLAT